MRAIVVGIDASRNRSGGAKAHLKGILGDTDPTHHGISLVHVWSYRSLLDELPDSPWLVKHCPPALEGGLLEQVWWQFRSLSGEVRAAGCDVLLNTDAGTVNHFQPSIVMSRDMLSYEAGEMRRYRFSRAWLRLMLLRFIQTSSMRRGTGVIFLTKYAARTIGEVTGKLGDVRVIPHGVGTDFRNVAGSADWTVQSKGNIRCLYVSNAAPYKHQWVVIEAIGILRSRGLNVSLCLAGGGSGKAGMLMDEAIKRTDPRGQFIAVTGAVDHDQVPSLLAAADIFVFASSCENMPNTLVEGMAAGLPIACSDRGPMPEVLQDGGLYFDPENAASVAEAVGKLITDQEIRRHSATRAKLIAAQYSWARCGAETWDFLSSLATSVR